MKVLLIVIFCSGCFDYNSLSNGAHNLSDGKADGIADGGASIDLDLVDTDLATINDLSSIKLPATCQAILDANPSAKDGTYTLYVGSKPWTAFCRDMAGTPKEYLVLSMVGLNQNFSQYTAGGTSPGTTVRTYYQRLRIDPAKLLVDVSDKTYTTSSGSLMHSGNIQVTSVPYGVAMDCLLAGSTQGMANLDLRGTPFTIAQGNFSIGGSMANGSATYAAPNQVNLTGGGLCGWWAAGMYAIGNGPFNNAGGFQLQLAYP